MTFVEVAVVFVVFFVGLVLAFQGVVGKEINPDGQPFRSVIDLEHPGIVHPPERHRSRLVLIGVGLMAVAVLYGVVRS